MMNKKVLKYINVCEGWKSAIKELHWDSSNMSQHELCDKIADLISEHQDKVSEVAQSISGKLPIGNLRPTSYKVSSLKKFVEDVLKESQRFLKEVEGMGDEYVGMKSDCESFISEMQRCLYLVNFTLNECKLSNSGLKSVRLTEGDIIGMVRESVKRVLREGLPEYEEVEVFNVLNDDFDGDWRSVLSANIYNKEGECFGCLKDMHFIYDVENDKLVGN